ncbi:adenosylcobinamide-GDP ribazoletransferase [Oscillatoria amoena NRMC-F 0135]|nr:adenosylcobinamide-GDP ribazoletransferase [Oscillatoria amoena NRMC-F 0135]
MIKNELRVFFSAVMFFTRIPVPAWVGHSDEQLNRAGRYFPLIGWIVGGWCALVFWLAAQIAPVGIALVLSMGAGILLTGAFHEDGFTDMCDGFGGGWGKEQILAIMKDSRIGAYGVIAITLMLGLKFLCLDALPVVTIPAILVAGHALSRLVAVSLLRGLDYVRDDASAKSKPLATRASWGNLLVASTFGLLPLLLLPCILLWALLPLVVFRFWFARYLRAKIGGYTGDCLGAAQQIAETLFYLSAVALL